MNVQDLLKLPTDPERLRAAPKTDAVAPDPDAPDFSEVMATIDVADGEVSEVALAKSVDATVDAAGVETPEGEDFAAIDLPAAPGATPDVIVPAAAPDTGDAALVEETAGQISLNDKADAQAPVETQQNARNAPDLASYTANNAGATVIPQPQIAPPSTPVETERALAATELSVQNSAPVAVAKEATAPALSQAGLTVAMNSPTPKSSSQVPESEAEIDLPEVRTETRVEKSAQPNKDNIAQNLIDTARPAANAPQQSLPQILAGEPDAKLLHDADMALTTEMDTIRAKDGLRSATVIPVADPRMARAVMNQISASLKSDDSGAIEIRLDPPELGRVALHVTPVEGGHMANVVADRPEILDLLRRHEALLAQELKDAGFGALSFSFSQQNEPPKDDKTAQHFVVAGSEHAVPQDDLTQIAIPTSSGQRLDIRL